LRIFRSRRTASKNTIPERIMGKKPGPVVPPAPGGYLRAIKKKTTDKAIKKSVTNKLIFFIVFSIGGAELPSAPPFRSLQFLYFAPSPRAFD
jgi:hypothetical protein